MSEIEQAYARAREAALAAWAEHEDAGRPSPPDYHEKHLGVSTGERFAASGWIAECHDRVLQCAARDPNVDVVPRESMHFTFLALARHEFPELANLPPGLDSVREAYGKLVAGLCMTVHRVHLLPLRNAVVLAGIPDEAALKARADFAAAVLAGPWAGLLRARYAGLAIPPVFWHTTLVRSDTAYLPLELRELYDRYADRTLESLVIGRPRLLATSYNWSTRIDL
jgi:hypothetical protein